jgi:cell division protein FtsL
MIVQRTIAGARPAPGARARRPSVRQRIAAGPAVAGRERLADVLGEHLAVQLMLVMSLVVFAALVYLHLASQVSVLQFNIAVLQNQQGNLNQTNAQLHAVQSSLVAPSRMENAATAFKMTKPDPGSTVWVTVAVPRVTPIRPIGADMAAAQQRSEPAAWVHTFISAVWASL